MSHQQAKLFLVVKARFMVPVHFHCTQTRYFGQYRCAMSSCELMVTRDDLRQLWILPKFFANVAQAF